MAEWSTQQIQNLSLIGSPFESESSYKYTFVVERQTRYTKDVESERALRVRIPPRVQYGSVAKLVVRIRLDQEKVVSEIRLLWREIP